jgi:hypothetical protein
MIISGNVGIGNTAPAGMLDILRSSGGTETLFLVGTSTADNLLTVKSSGNVGIGTTSPTSTLDAIGTFAVRAATSLDREFLVNSSGNVALRTLAGASDTHVCYDTTTISGLNTLSTCSSSLRYKEEVQDLSLTYDKDKLYSLRPVTFKWKNRQTRGVGFIAEEVAPVFPDMVFYDREGQIEGINYDQFSAYLLLGLKELDARVTKYLADQGLDWQVDEQGYLVIDKLKTSELAIKGDKTVGKGRIRQGDMAITIKTKAIKNTSKVFVSFLGDLAGRSWYISEKTEGEHFTVKLSGNLSYDIDFDWWVLGSEDDGSGIQYSSEPPPPSADTASTTSDTPAPPAPSPTLPTEGEGNAIEAVTPPAPPHEGGSGEGVSASTEPVLTTGDSSPPAADQNDNGSVTATSPSSPPLDPFDFAQGHLEPGRTGEEGVGGGPSVSPTPTPPAETPTTTPTAAP